MSFSLFGFTTAQIDSANYIASLEARLTELGEDLESLRSENDPIHPMD